MAQTASFDAKEFGQRLAQIRGEESQARFAARAGVEQTQLSKYERGVELPGTRALVGILHAGDVSADWLLMGKSSSGGVKPPKRQDVRDVLADLIVKYFPRTSPSDLVIFSEALDRAAAQLESGEAPRTKKRRAG